MQAFRKTFVIGDIHGAHLALVQVLERAGFERENDRLISLGDVSDQWPDTLQCVETLLGIPNLVPIVGNHDLWTKEWLTSGKTETVWEMNGGIATQHSYRACHGACREKHMAFFEQQVPYFEDEAGRLFVHAGYQPGIPIETQHLDVLAWDRKLITAFAKRHLAGEPQPDLDYKEVFLGHSSVQNITKQSLPLQMGTLWALDTGVKRGFPLTIMDVETKQYWQSDPSARIYGA